MNKLGRIIIVSVLSIGLFCLNPISAKAISETHIFNNGSKSLQMARPEGYSLYQQKMDSMVMQAHDSIRVQRTKHIKPKNPNIAFALAVFPGVCYHGVGHWYAGEAETALIVFATESVGVGILMVGAIGDPIKEHYQMSEEEKKTIRDEKIEPF